MTTPMKKYSPFHIVLFLGLLTIFLIPGRALLEGKTLLPLDLLHNALLPWANDVQMPNLPIITVLTLLKNIFLSTSSMVMKSMTDAFLHGTRTTVVVQHTLIIRFEYLFTPSSG